MRTFPTACIGLLILGFSSPAAGEPGVIFKPVEAGNPSQPSKPSEELALPSATDVLDIDLIIWRDRQYALVGGDRNVRLYATQQVERRLAEEPVARTSNRGSTLHIGFLPSLTQDDRLWFFVSSQREDVKQAAAPHGDVGLVTTFYTWDGRRIRRAKQILSVIYRRLGPTLISQRILAKKVVWGPVQTELPTVDKQGRLTLNRLGPLRLPAGAALYDFARGDLNGDGTTEIILAEGEGSVLAVYEQDGRSRQGGVEISMAPCLAEIKTFYWMAPYIRIMAPVVSDMDHDGQNDVVVVREEIVKEKGLLGMSSKRRFHTLAVFWRLNGSLSKRFESDRLSGNVIVFRHSSDNRLFTAIKEEDGSVRIHWVTLGED